jgi:hypothetical protein
MDDSFLSSRPRQWLRPVAFFSICTIAISSYLWYEASRYSLPKLKPFAGAEEDLFEQIKCLKDFTENPDADHGNSACRFRKVYESFWLSPRSLDSCFTYSTDNATTAFDSPKRLEFDFMCEGKAMRAKFSYQNGKYRFDGIGMTSP